MSFRFERTGADQADLQKALEADESVPAGAKEFVEDALKAVVKRWDKDQKVNVVIDGHLHTGEKGDTNVSTLTVRVEAA